MPKQDKAVAPTKTFTPDEAQRIRESILEVSNAGRLLLNSGLTKRAVAVLIQDATNIPLKTITHVLEAARDLGKLYLDK